MDAKYDYINAIFELSQKGRVKRSNPLVNSEVSFDLVICDVCFLCEVQLMYPPECIKMEC